MTELQPAHFTQGACHTAQGDRRLTSSLVCTEGVHTPAGGDLLVVATGVGLGINIGTGSAFINGDNIANQGMYHVFNNGAVGKTLVAANPTDPRIDSVFARVRDAQYSGVNNDWLLEVVTGTPSPVPAAPALPLNAIRLADILVPATFAGPLLAGNITDRRTAYQLCAGSVPADPTVTAELVLLNQNPFMARSRNTAQSVPDSTVTTVSWADLLENVPDGAGLTYDVALRTFTANKAGRYHVEAMINWATSATGRREIRILKNAALYAITTQPGSSQSFFSSAVSATVNLAVGDTIQIDVFQTSTGALDINASLTRNVVTVAFVGG